MNPARLLSLRQVRFDRLGLARGASYVDGDQVRRELAEARRIFQHRGWRSIDVSYMAVEEVA